MDKQLCFILDNENIYLDKVLVSFNDIPILFVCRDSSKNYYLVLCSNLEELEYIIVQQSLKNLWSMLTKNITMRTAFLSCESFWFVKSGNTIEEDECAIIPKSKMDLDALPFENAMYETISEDDTLYVDRITNEYLDNVSFDLSEEIKDITDPLFDVISPLNDCFGDITSYIDFGPVIQSIEISTTMSFSDNDFTQTSPLNIAYNQQITETKEVISLSFNSVSNKSAELTHIIGIAA